MTLNGSVIESESSAATARAALRGVGGGGILDREGVRASTGVAWGGSFCADVAAPAEYWIEGEGAGGLPNIFLKALNLGGGFAPAGAGGKLGTEGLSEPTGFAG